MGVAQGLGDGRLDPVCLRPWGAPARERTGLPVSVCNEDAELGEAEGGARGIARGRGCGFCGTSNNCSAPLEFTNTSGTNTRH